MPARTRHERNLPLELQSVAVMQRGGREGGGARAVPEARKELGPVAGARLRAPHALYEVGAVHQGGARVRQLAWPYLPYTHCTWGMEHIEEYCFLLLTCGLIPRVGNPMNGECELVEAGLQMAVERRMHKSHRL